MGVEGCVTEGGGGQRLRTANPNMNLCPKRVLVNRILRLARP